LLLPWLVLASVCSVGFFVWLAWWVKRLVYVAQQNSVLGLALLVSGGTRIIGSEVWLLSGGAFRTLL
jgi:hypothetical protein